MSRRIFTIAGRAGVIVLTDSKQNSNGTGSIYKYADPNGDTQMIGIKALNKVLNNIPKHDRAKLDKPVVFLLPRFLEFLKYEDTRKVWIETGCKKNQEVVAPELLEQVKILDTLVASLGSNIQLFGQHGLHSSVFKNYCSKTWKILDEIVPATNSASVKEEA